MRAILQNQSRFFPTTDKLAKKICYVCTYVILSHKEQRHFDIFQEMGRGKIETIVLVDISQSHQKKRKASYVFSRM